VIECEQCGYAHILPLPSDEELQSLYEDEFYQNDKDRYLQEAKEDIEWKKVEYGARFSIVEKIRENTKGTVLDIGCGPGDFLHLGKQRGWNVLGLEPSPLAARFASERGLDVKHAFFNSELIRELQLYEFIHMSEVLEHVKDPSQIVRQARDLLTDDGVLCISVPNDFNRFQSAVVKGSQKSHWWVQPHHHLNYFSFDSLSRLLEKNGFEIQHKTTNFPMEMFLLMGQDYSNNPSLGREMHAMRKHFDITLAENDTYLRDTFYSHLAELGLGRLVILFATKR
jgi:2-polyprenyl-3-methyl-5-hydroxy-6-metoxy-1,4-benzoquinol methylase